MPVIIGQLTFGEDQGKSPIRTQAIVFSRPVQQVIVTLSGFGCKHLMALDSKESTFILALSNPLSCLPSKRGLSAP